jgi:molybdate transport system substrate-binding protein
MTRRGFCALVLLGPGLFSGPSQARPADDKELVVFAAASLREVFESLAVTYEKRHKGVKVRFSFAGSQELRTQIDHGAQTDVFASADEKQMSILQNLGLVRSPAVFTKNEPVVVVPVANPAGLATFADLPKAGRLVVGAPEVPIGAYTESILAESERVLGKEFRTQVLAHIRSRELNVRQVLTKVVLGEGDAGIVYRSDALTAKGRVAVLAIPEGINVIASYPIAVRTGSTHPSGDLEAPAHIEVDAGVHPQVESQADGKSAFEPKSTAHQRAREVGRARELVGNHHQGPEQ